MKNGAYAIFLLPLLAGCLSSAPRAPINWTIDFSRNTDAVAARTNAAAAAVRIAAIDVRAPYSGQRLAVLRPDGSIAFDPCNAFAASPALLLRGAAHEAVEASGMFARVLEPGSSAKETYAMEIVVTQLALDCRTEGRRTAKVAFTLTLIEGRMAVACVRGAGAAEATDDFSAAFSTAFARAVADALAKLPAK